MTRIQKLNKNEDQIEMAKISHLFIYSEAINYNLLNCQQFEKNFQITYNKIQFMELFRLIFINKYIENVLMYILYFN